MHNVTCVRLSCEVFASIEFVGSFPSSDLALLAAHRHATADGLPVPRGPIEFGPDDELYRTGGMDGRSNLYHVVELNH